MVKKPTSAVGRAAHAMQKTTQRMRLAVNSTWRAATKAPMFLRSFDVKLSPSEEKLLLLEGNSKEARAKLLKAKRSRAKMRRNRCISRRSFMLATAGAGAHAKSALMADASSLRVGIEKFPKSTPWAPRLSAGAQLLIEQFLIAYAQHCFRIAVDSKEALKSGTSRVSAALMASSFDSAHDHIFETTLPVAKTVVVFPPPTKVPLKFSPEEREVYDKISRSDKAKFAKQKRLHKKVDLSAFQESA